MSFTNVLAACFMLASQTYSVPPAALVGIYKAEGGEIGMEQPNTNGTHDLGPMQINTLWVPKLAEKWNVPKQTAHEWLRDDACTNVGVAAWILRGHLNETESLSQAIAHYHSRTPHLAGRYKKRVISILEKNGLIQSSNN